MSRRAPTRFSSKGSRAAIVKPEATTSADGGIAIEMLYARLVTGLVSSGGRPARSKTSVAARVSLTEYELRMLDEVTQLVRAKGVRTTRGQVAGILLHDAISEVLRSARSAHQITGRTHHGHSNEPLEDKVERILAAAASAKKDLEDLRPIAEDLLSRMRAGRGLEDDADE